MKKFFLLLVVILIALIATGCSRTHTLVGQHAITSEKEFIQEMIPHHQEAVSSSQYLLSVTENESLQRFLEAVISLQSAEIEMLKEWHLAYFQTEYSDDVSAYQPMMPDFKNINTTPEVAYLQAMIEHHLMAIQMANDLLILEPTRPELVEFAQAIIRVQSDEIQQMNKLLESL